MRLIRFLDNEDKEIKYCASENETNYLIEGDIFSNFEVTSKAVSYTHLTLPTIYSV